MNAALNSRPQGLSGRGKMIAALVIIFLIVGFIVWMYYYRSYRQHSIEIAPMLIAGKVNAMNERLSARSFPLADPNHVKERGFGFAYSFWIYIRDWQYKYGKPKYMFIKGDPKGPNTSWSPAIWLDARENTLCTSMALSDSRAPLPPATSHTGGGGKPIIPGGTAPIGPGGTPPPVIPGNTTIHGGQVTTYYIQQSIGGTPHTLQSSYSFGHTNYSDVRMTSSDCSTHSHYDKLCKFIIYFNPTSKTLNIHNINNDGDSTQLGIKYDYSYGKKIPKIRLFKNINNDPSIIKDFIYTTSDDLKGDTIKLSSLSFKDSDGQTKQFSFSNEPSDIKISTPATITLQKTISSKDKNGSGSGSVGATQLGGSKPPTVASGMQITREYTGTGPTMNGNTGTTPAISMKIVYYLKQIRDSPAMDKLQLVPVNKCAPGDTSCYFKITGDYITSADGKKVLVLTNAFGRLNAYMMDLNSQTVALINKNVAAGKSTPRGAKMNFITQFNIYHDKTSGSLTLNTVYEGSTWYFAFNTTETTADTMNIDVVQSSAQGFDTTVSGQTIMKTVQEGVETFENSGLMMGMDMGLNMDLNMGQPLRGMQLGGYELFEAFVDEAAPSRIQNCHVEGIPLQKWVHIAYVLNNRTIDIYVNGRLERSCQAPGVPLLNDEALRISPSTSGISEPGFFGEYAKVQYFFNAIDSTDVARLYASGPY